MKKIRDGGEKDDGCFIGLVPYKTLLCVKFEFHGWNLKWKEGIWISEKKKKKKKKTLNDGWSVHRL